MGEAMAASVSVICLALASVGCTYMLAATLILARTLRVLPSAAGRYPAVTILKPLHGAELELYENLASFCDQDYPSSVQILFGVQDRDDPAIAVVQNLMAHYTERDLELVVDPRLHGPNRKVGNLTNLESRIKHEVVIVADSDIRVESDYLARVTAVLQESSVGLVTCLYRGRAAGRLWAHIACLAIDCHFLPSALVGLWLGLARPCFGSTIALRRATLAQIGGFAAFARYLADDNAIGEAVRRAGMEVAIPQLLVTHVCTERSFADLMHHQLRAARTIRVVAPWGFAGSVVTYPLPLALLGTIVSGFDPIALTVLAAVVFCRLVLQVRVDHTLRVSPPRWWLSPLADLLLFAVFVASFFMTRVSWRGYRYKVLADGTLMNLSDAR